jgi:hypothetical protein
LSINSDGGVTHALTHIRRPRARRREKPSQFVSPRSSFYKGVSNYPAQAKAAKANEVVCKSNLETGSLVKQHKRIHSATTIGRDFVLRARAIRPLA